MSRPISQEGLYARELGLGGTDPMLRLRRAGGAEKCKKLDDFTRNLLFKRTGPPLRNTGLTARGMTGAPAVPKCFKPAITEWEVNRMYVAHKIWRER